MKKLILHICLFVTFFHISLLANTHAKITTPEPKCKFELEETDFDYNEQFGLFDFSFNGSGLAEYGQLPEFVGLWRAIRYRPEGTDDWTVIYDYLIDNPAFSKTLYTIPYLTSCTRYEVQITCGYCYSNFGPFPDLECLEELNTMIAEWNISQIFTVDTPHPPSYEEPVTNLHIVPDPSNASIVVNWDPKPNALMYRVEIIGSNQLGWCDDSYTTTGTTTTIPFAGICNGTCESFTIVVKARMHCATSLWFYSDGAAIVSIPIGDCTINLNDVQAATYEAEISWIELFGDPNEFQVDVYQGANLFSSITTSENPLLVTGLTPNTQYSVSVAPICTDSECLRRDRSSFKTDCDTYEPNNFPSEAMAIPFEEEILTKMTEDDVDYFSFVPTCNAITLYKSIIANSTIFKDGEVVPYSVIIVNNGPDIFYYDVIPGEEYLIRFENTYEEGCYTFDLKECDKCYENPQEIEGNSLIPLPGGFSVVETYSINAVPSSVTWEVDGPASIEANLGDVLKLRFTQTGTVILTASFTTCGGEIRIFTKVIEIEGESFIQPPTDVSPLPYTGDLCCFGLATTGYDVNATSFHWKVTSMSTGLTEEFFTTWPYYSGGENCFDDWAVIVKVAAVTSYGESAFYTEFVQRPPMPQCEDVKLIVSPNPGNGIIKAELFDGEGSQLGNVNGTILIRDIYGTIFLKLNITNPVYEFDTSALKDGVYHIFFTNGTGSFNTAFVKE